MILVLVLTALRATRILTATKPMQYDLLRAFMMRVNRRGKNFKFSPAVLDFVNERLEREAMLAEEQTVAQVPLDSAYGSSESSAPSAKVV
jgi:hypothetical protein